MESICNFLGNCVNSFFVRGCTHIIYTISLLTYFTWSKIIYGTDDGVFQDI